MKKISKIIYNWMPSQSDGKEVFGEECQEQEVGKRGVTEIQEHPARGDGDKWFYDVIYANGQMIRVFNPNLVFFD